MKHSSRSGAPMHLRLERGEAVPLFRQIDDQIRKSILAGQLREGDPLPSTRALAADLEVSRNTVRLAFEQLMADGYLVSEVGAGTRVAPRIPIIAPRATPALARQAATPRGRGVRRLRTVGIPSAEVLAPPHQAAFRVGLPALDHFPVAAWARLAGRRWRRVTAAQLGYGDMRGEPTLRAAIARHIGVTRGISCTPNQVLIVSGSQGALDLIARVLLRPGDPVWVEDPGYFGARGPVVAAGARIVAVPVDNEGMVIAAGVRRAARARAAFITPSHQFPTGVVMSLARRLELLAWARRQRAWIIEDDYDSEFRYDAHPVTALHGLNQGEGVIYIGTLSKTLCPALRLGYLVLPVPLVDDFVLARRFIDTSPPTTQQLVAADFMSEGHYSRHLRQMRTLYHDRQMALVREIEGQARGRLEVGRSGAGMHILAWLPEGTNEQRLVEAAAAEGIHVMGLSVFRWRGGGPPGIVLGYGGVSVREMPDAVGKLVRALRIAGVAGRDSDGSAR